MAQSLYQKCDDCSKEDQGILGRAGYYDQSGALKDMVQSHLLQILSLLAWKCPLATIHTMLKTKKLKL